MKPFPLLVGGVIAGLIIVAGEAVLNLGVLADEWANLFLRFKLPEPTPLIAAQGVLKLLLLGIFSVWLALAFKPAFSYPHRAGIVSGLCIWFLVWAWVQWGMWLAGYVTAPIAITTVAWGFVELPLAAWAGTWVHWRLIGGSR
ncbi:hypothetical protein IVG45_18800 [Methylomonas sp. LL1]|uniref:hypothetical protein n=1 Tax=Methylomonas sp. LL1 TaxID=2785785 RepID=UPI0018C3A14D|nr:hypothetical protein [Methylomonas sp. LL1]QPK62853.1 hypothetical protein IVG45_18800 [Methylomonas sp. LL1]